jgi:hypothetical protein
MSIIEPTITAFALVVPQVVQLLSLLRQSQHMQWKGKQKYMTRAEPLLMHAAVSS